MPFVCSRTRLRSLTAERVFAAGPACRRNRPAGGRCASAGHPGVAAGRRWCWSWSVAAHLRHRRVICLQRPDEDASMHPALVRRLEHTVPPLLGLPAQS
ncbi:phosphatase [Xanthomonas citri pv. malvacearum str. GSPB2388]|nr:phosphatase [Xanthomonas citri pv. malvacearum str. GSPB2388]